MGFSEADQKACRSHPNHDQRYGVCPACLTERLSQLYVITSSYNHKDAMVAVATSCSSSDYNYNNSSSPDDFVSSSSSSLKHVSSPPGGGHRKHRRVGSMSFRLGGGVDQNNDGFMKKSKSIGFVQKIHLGGQMRNSNEKKKKGFWSKLLHLKGKKQEEVLMHSVTMKQAMY